MTPQTIIGVVDPGIRGCGVARFVDTGLRQGVLVAATYVRSPERHGNGPFECSMMAREVYSWLHNQGRTPDIMIVEWPRIYSAAKQAGKDPNDLLPLTGIGVGVCALFGVHCVRYYPDEWKGQMSKDAMNERVKGRLSEQEIACVACVGALDHNTYDAIGIGLHHLGRLQRKRVFAR